MKRALKIVGLLVGGLALLVGAFLAWVAVRGIPKYAPGAITLKAEATPERLARGKRFASTLCSGCHMNPTTGHLTGKVMEDAPKEFGTIVSANITKHPDKGIGSWTDGELAYLFRTGVRRDGQYLPPYMPKWPHLSDEDLLSIIAFLRSDDPLVAAGDVDPPGRTQPSFLTKLLATLVFKPLPYPDKPKVAPSPLDKVAFGRYLVAGFDCYGCHSADFKKMNVLDVEKSVGFMGGGNELLDLRGQVIRSANLTFDEETGIGKWSEQEFIETVRGGIRPDKSPLRYPMGPIPEFSNEEVGAIYAYLKTLPKIKNKIDRRLATVDPSASPGKQLYVKYACVSCHGDAGVGVADLRNSRASFPTDEQLIAWIKNAPSIRPATKMPKWEGIIAEADFAPLAAYVRELGDKKK